MAGLVPAIHVLSRVEDVDPRNKSGDDDGGRHSRLKRSEAERKGSHSVESVCVAHSRTFVRQDDTKAPYH
jgi:hypothetical protein